MARFTPARFFRRRFSSRDSSTTSVSPPDPTRAETRGRPQTKSPAAPVLGSSQSTSSRGGSLRKFRREATQPNAEVPESLAELTRSQPLPDHAEGDEEEEVKDYPGSFVSAERERRVNQEEPTRVQLEETEEGTDRNPEKTPAEDLTIDLEKIRTRPLLVVQEPTPVVVEDLDGNLSRNISSAGSSAHRQRSLGSDLDTPATSTSFAETFGAAERRDCTKLEYAGSVGPTIIASRTRSDPTASEAITAPTRDSKQHYSHQPETLYGANENILNAHTVTDFSSAGAPVGFSNPSCGALSATSSSISPETSEMPFRKIWVKRPGASATLVQIKLDDLVDDVRDMILQKYANSLGKTFDAPDMTLHIISRADTSGQQVERMLGPDEEMSRTIDSYFPGGQTVDDALIIIVPQRRTPRPSPKVWQHHSYQAVDDYRPMENGTDYFPPMPAFLPTTIPQTSGSHESRTSHNHHLNSIPQPADHPRAMTVLSTGQVPPLPSPGATSRRHQHRPKTHRQPTSSPTILSHTKGAGIAAVPPLVTTQQVLAHRQSTRPRLDSSATEAIHSNGVPAPPPLPSPPAPEAPPTAQDRSTPPTPSTGIPMHTNRPARPKRSRKPTPESRSRSQQQNDQSVSTPSLGHPMLDASVPPINVLIVEDNIINLRILEGLMKRLKVRWQTAMNGQIAVDKWKTGGYHLVLMDIQMPVMSGLQATKEIRRLERVNSIGVFSSSPITDSPEKGGRNAENSINGSTAKNSSGDASDDQLSKSDGFFKSPVIIVALTASSLQSDRHEALAAGCNDFLTKPVNFVWLERKVKEWGCMQALIDFDGWRKWKEYAAKEEAGKSEGEKAKEREKEEKDRKKAEKLAILQERAAQRQKAEKEEKERKKRQSLGQTESEALAPLAVQEDKDEAKGTNGFQA